MKEHAPLIAALIALVGVLVTAFVAWQNGRIHRLVNSQLDQAKREIREAQATNAVLLRYVTRLTGTSEDQVRAEVAAELAARRSVPRIAGGS